MWRPCSGWRGQRGTLTSSGEGGESGQEGRQQVQVRIEQGGCQQVQAEGGGFKGDVNKFRGGGLGGDCRACFKYIPIELEQVFYIYLLL